MPQDVTTGGALRAECQAPFAWREHAGADGLRPSSIAIRLPYLQLLLLLNLNRSLIQLL